MLLRSDCNSHLVINTISVYSGVIYLHVPKALAGKNAALLCLFMCKTVFLIVGVSTC